MLYIHPTSASTAAPASRYARLRRSSTKTTCPANGRSSPTENARFFDHLGSPGGAAKTGPLPDDTDCVASYVTSR